MMKLVLITIIFFSFMSCKKQEIDNDTGTTTSLYFPPVNSQDWAKLSFEELGWDQSQKSNLVNFLLLNNTRAFIILKNGKIVMEEYFGNNILNTAPFDSSTWWYWASAAKSLTASLIGIAQQEGQLDINKATSQYLGPGWTSMPLSKEQLITVRHQMSMTTGLNYNVSDLDCTDPSCLTYNVDAGTQWYYHNAAYTLLESVVEKATGIDYNEYTNKKIGAIIGMNGKWITQGYNNIYWSTARDMARYGLLMLNKGKWNSTEVLTDKNFYNQMISSSQNLNPSYGFLWWLNGKNSIIYPSLPSSFNVSLSHNAPTDLFAGMGKNGQFVDVVPSQNLVVVRMGEAPDGSTVPISFHDEMWNKINLIIK